MFAVILLLILALYAPILNSYFQQDEWFDFGYEQIRWLSNYGFVATLKKAIFSLSPVVQTYNLVNYYFFGLQNVVPAVTIITLLIANSVLWYRNVLKLSGSKFIAGLSLLLGYTSYLSQQSVTWVMPAVAIQFSFFFSNLAIVYFLKFEKYKQKQHLLLLLLFTFLAVFSKFNSFFLFAFFPVIYFLRNMTLVGTFKNLQKMFFGLVGLLTSYYLFFYEKLQVFSFGQGRFIEGKFQLAINSVFLPLKSLSQILISDPKIVYDLGNQLITKYYRQVPNDLLTYVVIAEFVSILLSVFLLVILHIIIKPSWKKYKSIILFFATYYVFSFLPYTVDLFSTGTGFLESRYYNVSVFSFAVIVSVAAKIIIQSTLQITKPLIRATLLFFLLLTSAVYVFYNVYSIHKSILLSNTITQKRLQILTESSDDFGRELSNTFIIYSNDRNYLGTKNLNITGRNFQTGLLYPLLVFNYERFGRIPKDVFSDYYFWNMNFQGTKKTAEYEIGLFYDYYLLVKYVKENDFPINQVFTLDFDYSSIQNGEVIYSNYKDIVYAEYSEATDEIREKLTNEVK